MHFFVSVIDSVSGSATSDEGAAIDAFNDELKLRGHWVLAGGIAGPDQSVTIDARGAEAVTTDGPVAEADDFAAGSGLGSLSRLNQTRSDIMQIIG